MSGVHSRSRPSPTLPGAAKDKKKAPAGTWLFMLHYALGLDYALQDSMSSTNVTSQCSPNSENLLQHVSCPRAVYCVC